MLRNLLSDGQFSGRQGGFPMKALWAGVFVVLGSYVVLNSYTYEPAKNSPPQTPQNADAAMTPDSGTSGRSGE
jgi:hypothetical protein